MFIFRDKNDRGFKELGQYVLQESVGCKDRNGWLNDGFDGLLGFMSMPRFKEVL